MGIDNSVTIAGNLGDDPELRFTPTGLAVAQFSVAVYGGKDKPSDWFDVTCWEKLAENVAESCVKGGRVTVYGRITQDRWEDKETGQKRSKVKIVADDVALSLKWDPAEARRVEREKPADRRAAVQHPDEEPF
jgi:single-strand DNA-binding protein